MFFPLFSTGGEVNLSLDGSSSKSPIDMFAFTSPDVETLTLGGAPSTITVENQNLKDFPGCLSAFELDGQQLPLIGETANYVITASESIDNGCSDLCTNACDGECTIQGEAIACAPKADAPLTVGIIVVIVFFSVISVVIVILLVVFRKRGAQCLKGTKAARQNGSLGKGANSSGHSNQDSGYGENNIDQLIIRNHINQELASSGYQRHMNGHLVQPDIINSEIGRTPMPLDLEDGTVIIDNASDVTHLRDLNSEMPVLYDLDNASSIAPSDIDIVDHYRHFHDNGGRQRRKNKAHSDHSHHSKHSSKHVSQSNHSNHSHHSHGVARDSPNISSVPFMNNLARDSPVSRNSPINQLSRTSPNVRQSPFTHVNMVRGHNMPVTDLNGGSRTTSEHSVASHRSKASNSTPNKPRRQMLPNGQPNGNLLNPNYENSKFLTKEEVDRLNARPRQSPASLMEAFSTSSENNTRQMKKPLKHYQDTNVLLEPPESSSDGSANDSFTCSEFEYENDKPRNDFDAKIFSKIKEENEHEDGAYHNKNFKSDGLDSGGNSFSSTERPPEENTLGQSTGKSVSNPFSWDDLLNWGPKFEKLVGVFTDIAMLPDAESADFSEVEGKSTDREEYV
ncbi:hypothetical protein DPMN_116224 [Dreissena polymorpha]|uniref:Laminin G domain-containing protein n=1 Tax=Dreissena polymorpha TaxID=45954 RepID=A0A9D4KMP8_DREPO|nr:hypothetical protein DPMN_116224 [Dreissena polymorpha]